MSGARVQACARAPTIACAAIATLGFAALALGRVAWTWDGAFLFFRLFEDRSPPIAHGRLTNGPLLSALLWLESTGCGIDELAIAQGVLYTSLSVLALVAGLAMIPSSRAHLRTWVVLGVLFVPLPGQMCPTMETTPALQLVWPLVAFVWSGYGARWLPVAGLVAVASFFLHPVAGLGFALVAWVAASDPNRTRARRIAIVVFSALAVGRVALTASTLADYERAQFALGTVAIELASVSFLAPVAVVLVLLLCAARTDGLPGFRDDAEGGRAPDPIAWALVAAIGIAFFHDARGWSGAMNYRKFGIVLAAVFVALAVRDARRPGSPRLRPAALLVPAAVFALSMALGAASWERELRRLADAGTLARAGVLEPASVPGLEGTALHHWSGAVTSLLVQGREPEFVLRSYGVVVERDGVRLWPGADLGIEFDPAANRFLDMRSLSGVVRQATP